MNRFLFTVSIILFFTAFAGAQEKLVDLKGNPVLNAKHEELKKKYRTIHTDSIPFSNPYTLDTLPFVDNFQNGGPFPDSSKWIDNYTFVNNGYPVAPMNWGVVTFDGLNADGYPYDFTAAPSISVPCDTLTSKRIKMIGKGTAPGDTIYLRFYYEAQGRGNQPEPEDSLLLEFRSYKDSTWLEAWSHPGYALSGNDTVFHRVMIPINLLDTGKYINNPWFQFRFRNYATPCGNLDHWHVDCVSLRE